VKVLVTDCLNISRRYTDRMKFAAYTDFSLSHFFMSFCFNFYYYIYGCMFCTLLFKFGSYVFLFILFILFL